MVIKIATHTFTGKSLLLNFPVVFQRGIILCPYGYTKEADRKIQNVLFKDVVPWLKKSKNIARLYNVIMKYYNCC